ncbi:hypothetical protein C7C46_13885 [Streptomyces tateyamensis]|uniref:DUF402 domain-containing protein n=1 Tax=Streptomyces tateyamensis TaxID=565073 RepID=A0A2V4NCM5_9ACTN|nr:hypothetical protein [Streptomyces tateyamensis]PYC79454.1 hypothetical protein C7C46_13885 [Streptomyces tateyamensis]
MTSDEPVTALPCDERVSILHNGRLRAASIRRGDVVAYDWGFHQDGAEHVQRTFVLLDEGLQVNQPVLFPPEQRGWWYRDLLTLAWDGADRRLLRTQDLWLDVIVGPPDHPYRLLDLDDYADAPADGRLSPDRAAEGLRRMQRFLDRRLNRRHDTTRSRPEFPPPLVEELRTAELPRDRRLLD